MFPLALFGILAGFLAWLSKPTHGEGEGSSIGFVPEEQPTKRILARQLALGAMPSKAPPFHEEAVAPGMMGPPLQPQEERLLSLLILWGKDKRFPVGKKKYLTRALAVEAAKIAMQLGLRGTARAVLSDGRIPANERMGNRGVTVMQALVAFSNGRKVA